MVVKDNQIIGRGRTSFLGRPHAEENALKSIVNLDNFKNTFMYLTLEPCAHRSKKIFLVQNWYQNLV